MFTVESGDCLASMSESLSSEEDMMIIVLALLQDVLSVVLTCPNVVTHYCTVHYSAVHPRVTFQAQADRQRLGTLTLSWLVTLSFYSSYS